STVQALRVGSLRQRVDENCREVKTSLITPHACGVVLDVGAAKVTKYVALEPNIHMNSKIRKVADAAGFIKDVQCCSMSMFDIAARMSCGDNASGHPSGEECLMVAV
ncbi:hypothetical protein BC835DRAFT_1035614, partial [Cytidiella melzeri]